jgi:hypothetical protein
VILAQTSIEPSFLLQFALVVGLLVSIAANVVMIRRSGQTQSRQIGPQPFEIKAATEYATKEELHRLEEHFDSFRAELFSTLKEREIERSKNLARLHERMDEMPSRIIGLLKETKHLIP